jgi:hypothetical protein
MNEWDDVFDDNENPYTILINELRRSNDFFQLLSETLNDSSFQQQAKYAIKNLSDIETYILDCDDLQLDELLERINGF